MDGNTIASPLSRRHFIVTAATAAGGCNSGACPGAAFAQSGASFLNGFGRLGILTVPGTGPSLL